MYLFSRTVTLKGDPRQTMPFAVAMCELVNRKIDLQVSLWMAVFGAPVGTLHYTTLVHSHAEFEAATASLLTDDEYLEKGAQGEKYLDGPIEDQMVEILHNSGTYRRAEVGWIGNVVTAQVSNARFGAAINWSIEMADLATEITGNPGMFGRATAGPFGSVGWISVVPDMAALDWANEALGKDARYLAKLDHMGDLFLPGSGRTEVTRRIA